MEIAYEDLLDAPEATLKKICDFLQETYEVEMMEFYQNPVKYNTDKHNRQNLARPLITANKEKWRKSMDDKDVRLFEAIAGEMLETYGYIRKNTTPVIYPLERIFYDKLMYPLKKIRAMLINSTGHKEAFIKMKIYNSLRLGWYLRHE